MSNAGQDFPNGSNLLNVTFPDHTTLIPLTQALSELARSPQWVCFDTTKKPYNPATGKGADCNKPGSWATFEDARRAWRARQDRYQGIGFELVKAQGLTCVDLDKCIVDGQISAYAQAIIQRLNSYTEYSPSGAGIHIWARGSIPENFKADGNDGQQRIEMYTHERYITFTGKPLEGTPEAIEARQEQLTALFTEVSEHRRQVKAQKRMPPRRAAPLDQDSAYGLAALSTECRELASTAEGGRNERLNSAAYSMGQLIAGKELSRLTVEQQLAAAAQECGLDEREIEATMRSGIEAGLHEPRSRPQTRAEHADHQEGRLPEVVIGGQLREMTARSLEALKAGERTQQTLFVQSARLIQVARDEKQRPIIMHVGTAEMKNALTRNADFFRLKKVGPDEYTLVPVSPPKEVADAVLALKPIEWPFPALEAIVETPVIRPDGSILDTPGYDERSHLYYAPHAKLGPCHVPEKPTQADCEQALAYIWDIIGEFPYATQADRANALALLITPILRPMIPRHVPLALIDAPKQGTGKGLLSDVVSINATGEPASILTAPDNEEEWDKRITAKLMQGSTIITIDNIAGRLQSAKLDAVLTANIYEGRLLGQSTMLKVPNRATWIATGNNIRLGGDLPRRCYAIRLDPQVSQPWMRSGFKHEDLATYVSEHRADLISACLTVVRSWIVAGKPEGSDIPHLGTFTGWAKIVGSILQHAGIEGFLGNLKKLYDEADDESAEWEMFLQTWLETFGAEKITTQAFFEKVAGSGEKVAGSALIDALPEYLQVALKEKESSFKIKLGKALERRVDACYGERNLHLEKDLDTHKKQKLWKVVAGSAGSATSHVRNENALLSHQSKMKSINKNRNRGEYYPHYPQGQGADVALDGSTSRVSDDEKVAGSQTALPATSEQAKQESAAALYERLCRLTTPEYVAWKKQEVPLAQYKRKIKSLLSDTRYHDAAVADLRSKLAAFER